MPDRKAETLANWLRTHPGIAILSRDRAAAYRLGMTQGAPDAVQVADRFHLVENLSEALESILSGYTRELDQIGQHPASLLENTVVVLARVGHLSNPTIENS